MEFVCAGGDSAEEAERAVPGVAAAGVPDHGGVARLGAGRAPGAGGAAGVRSCPSLDSVLEGHLACHYSDRKFASDTADFHNMRASDGPTR